MRRQQICKRHVCGMPANGASCAQLRTLSSSAAERACSAFLTATRQRGTVPQALPCHSAWNRSRNCSMKACRSSASRRPAAVRIRPCRQAREGGTRTDGQRHGWAAPNRCCSWPCRRTVGCVCCRLRWRQAYCCCHTALAACCAELPGLKLALSFSSLQQKRAAEQRQTGLVLSAETGHTMAERSAKRSVQPLPRPWNLHNRLTIRATQPLLNNQAGLPSAGSLTSRKSG